MLDVQEINTFFFLFFNNFKLTTTKSVISLLLALALGFFVFQFVPLPISEATILFNLKLIITFTTFVFVLLIAYLLWSLLQK